MLKDLYYKKYGTLPTAIEPLTPAGSNRRYYRLSGQENVIGVIGTSVEENKTFIYLSQHFASLGLPVPRVIAVSDDTIGYLQDDLGDISLFSVLHEEGLIEKAVAQLPRLQYLGSKGLDFSKCFPVSTFDEQSILWDLNYFKYCFLNTTGIAYSEQLLEKDFRQMAERLSAKDEDTFMYRDFQSRNVMIKDGMPYFIDFQGGRRGPAVYDLVSFVNQSKAAYPESLKRRLISIYIENASVYTHIDPDDFHGKYREFSLLRTLQVFGAYGFRGRFERKPHFLHSIAPAISNLENLISEPFERYPYMMKVLADMIAKEKSPETIMKTDSGLTVTVCSFSYKKGIPDDKYGNGGGFVFDCRGMDNPGRYPEFKKLTGLDSPVIDFLEKKGEIITFLEHCFALVDKTIECYDSRGFTSLMVNYGCTGGQHRSVYSAQKTAEHIKAQFPHVNVHLIHRERNIDLYL